VSCSAGRAVLRVIDECSLIDNARMVGAAMQEALKRVAQKYDLVGDVRGRGLMMAAELVTDRRSKQPATEETHELFQLTRKHGLVASKSGVHRNVIRICPPLSIQLEDVAFFEQAIDASFADLYAGVRA